MFTRHRVKHRTAGVWDECKSHMEEKDLHYYLTGPRHIHASSPLYSASCFITPHHPKSRFEYSWAIPPTLTGEDGHPVFHTIINRSDKPASNHIAPDKDLLVPDASVNYDNHFPDQLSRALDVCAFQLSQHLKGKWYHALRKATATNPLFDIVSINPNHPTVHMFPMKEPTKVTISEARYYGSPMNKWHTWEPRNVLSTPPDTSTR